MQPGEAQKGVSTRSQLFNSLRVYLNNKNRLQPIIGLGSIIECVKAGTQHREVLYLCEVCVCRLSKADMRNHIMGSLHRYNYIKAWHPHLVSDWKEMSDLSKLAWPLMEMATVLERKEGPGEVQWLDVDDAVYQKMATHSESAAVTLITLLKDGQGQGEPERHSETTSVQLEHYPIQPQRMVLVSQNQERRSKNSLKTSAETNATFIESEGWFTDTPPEPSVLSENGFLDGYTGTEPLIGLYRVVECRSEDGHTYCFLCHCCRIRSNKKDIIDHLTKSSHLVNYLMESHPEEEEVMMADINDNYPLLQSLAKRVEREEGRGELKVVNAPESLCRLLTGKSYHWCIKMLCNGWAHTDIQKQKIAVKGLCLRKQQFTRRGCKLCSVSQQFNIFCDFLLFFKFCGWNLHFVFKGPSVNKTSNEVMPEQWAAPLSQWPKRLPAKRKKRKRTKPVFNVSLPLTRGAMLLERTSFSTDRLPVSFANSDLDLTPLPESPSEGCELDYDAGSFETDHAEHTSQHQHGLYGEDANAGQYVEPERNFMVTLNQEVDGYFNDNEHFNRSEDSTATKHQKVYWENNCAGPHGYQERSSERFYNKGPQTQTEWQPPAVSYTQDMSSYYSHYGGETSCTDQWYNSTSQGNIGTRAPGGGHEMNSIVMPQHYYYQQLQQNQSMAQSHAGLLAGGAGQHGYSGDYAAHSGAAWVNSQHGLGGPYAHWGGVVPQPAAPFHEIEQRQLPTYTGVHHWS